MNSLDDKGDDLILHSVSTCTTTSFRVGNLSGKNKSTCVRIRVHLLYQRWCLRVRSLWSANSANGFLWTLLFLGFLRSLWIQQIQCLRTLAAPPSSPTDPTDPMLPTCPSPRLLAAPPISPTDPTDPIDTSACVDSSEDLRTSSKEAKGSP